MKMQLEMLKEHNIPSRDNSELHQKHLATGGHLGGQNNLVPKGDNVLDGLIIYQVCSSFDFDNSLVGADSVVAVREVEAESEVGSVLEEDIADRAVDNVV